MDDRFLSFLWRGFGPVLVAFLLAGWLAYPVAARSVPNVRAGTFDPTELGVWLDGYMPYALRSGDVAGGVVMVVKDGAVVAARGYGWADIARARRVDPARTLFRVGSVSKLFTWTAVMQQVEAGKLDLDRDVNDYIDFRIPPYRGRPVTLRQLMTHTAGFELAGKDTITFNAPIALGPYLKRWIPLRIYAPGTTPAYSNWGTALAGYIVERAAGMSFDDYVERHIFAPLDMRHASFRQPLPPSLVPFLAAGYARATSPPQGFEVIGPAPAGALSASGADMARFMIAHLQDGGGLMSAGTAAIMHHSPLDRIDPRSLVPPLNRAELGFLQMNINGHRVIGHGGDTQNFHSLLALFVDDGVGLFVSFNSAGRAGAAGRVRDQLFGDFADRYFPDERTAVRIDPHLARDHARMMAGQWQDSRHAENSFLALAMLAGQTKVALTPDGGLLIPSLVDASGAPYRWDEVAPFVWRSRTGHERLAAQVVAGRVVRWSTDGIAPTGVFDRVPASRSAAWLVPALLASLVVLALAAVSLPFAWLARQWFRVPHPLVGHARHLRRAVAVASLLALATLGGWMLLLGMMFSNISLIGVDSDPWLRLLQVVGALVLAGALAIALWHAVVTCRSGRRWWSRLWSLFILIAMAILFYVAAQFGLLVQGTNY